VQSVEDVRMCVGEDGETEREVMGDGWARMMDLALVDAGVSMEQDTAEHDVHWLLG
jgi:hypothetical protein